MNPEKIRDFELKISASGDGKYRVEVIGSPSGESSAPLQLSLQDPEFIKDLKTLEMSRERSGDSRVADNTSRKIGSSKKLESNTAEAINRLGVQLFRGVFNSAVAENYRTSLQMVRDEGGQLRLRLRIDTPELAALPWEFIYDEREGDPLCLIGDTHLVRYLPLGRPQKSLTITPPLRILGMTASPDQLKKLDTGGEKKLMHDAVDHLLEAGKLEIEWVKGQTWRDLEAAMDDGPWHVFHFIGHGDINSETGEGYIALCDEKGGVQEFDATRLGRMLAGHKSLKLAVLNCCKGGTGSEQSLVSSVGAKLMQRGLPAVVSMQYEITDKAALEFSREFYSALAQDGLPIDMAVTQARKTITYAIDDTLEWATPVLHMRSPDGGLFDFDKTGAIFGTGEQQKTPDAGASPQPQEEISSPVAKPDDRLRKSLLRLLHLVRRSWVHGVLDVALEQGEMVDLRFSGIPEQVDSPWGATAIREDASILSIFDELGGSLLILGVPGSGKTIQMLSLARALIDRAEQDATRAVPVVVNLSSWERGMAFPQWFSKELSAKYGCPPGIAGNWLQDHRLLLLLDGLDEVSGSLRDDCVYAINDFMEKKGPVKVVACCRYKEYTQLSVKLGLTGAISLKNLTWEQVERHIDKAGDQLAGLKAALQKHSELRILAQTPFHLNTMVRTYWGKQQVDLASMGIVSKNERHEEIMNDFVARQFERVQAAASNG